MQTDAREDYSFMREIMELPGVELQKKLNAIKPIKERLRNEYHIWMRSQERPQWHYSEDGESRWCKAFFDSHFTEEEKQEFIKWKRKEINSPYDCTGLWFTRYISIFNLPNGKSVVYAFEGLDV